MSNVIIIGNGPVSRLHYIQQEQVSTLSVSEGAKAGTEIIKFLRNNNKING